MSKKLIPPFASFPRKRESSGARLRATYLLDSGSALAYGSLVRNDVFGKAA